MKTSTAIRLALGLVCVAALVAQEGVSAQPAQKKKASGTATASARTGIPAKATTPYLGAIVADAATGQVLFEDGADRQGYPASVTKLMDMAVIFDLIEQGRTSLSNRITVTREAAGVGGTQVWLKEKESFTVDELLYALMLQSANDAAVALAVGLAGSQEAFIEMMNRKAAELGMTNSTFASVHGLPPTGGRSPDVSTARDLATLARAVLRHKAVLGYTSTRFRAFRQGTSSRVDMHNHNHLLESYPGCDGLKTGWITLGGYSIVVTAERGGRRVIAVVLDSAERLVRDKKAAELLSRGFTLLPPLPPPAPVITNIPPTVASPTAGSSCDSAGWSWGALVGGVLGGLVIGIAVVLVVVRRPKGPRL